MLVNDVGALNDQVFFDVAPFLWQRRSTFYDVDVDNALEVIDLKPEPAELKPLDLFGQDQQLADDATTVRTVTTNELIEH